MCHISVIVRLSAIIKDVGKISKFLFSFKMSQIISVLGKLARSGEVLTALIIILVATCSFGLGRLSVQNKEKEPFQINRAVPQNEVANTLSATAVNSGTSSGKVVASKNGTKYHFPWCSGAKNISEANKIFFDSKEEAEKAGYSKASNCKGL